MPSVLDQDDKFFYFEGGKKAAKSGLSEAKRKEYENTLGTKVVTTPEPETKIVGAPEIEESSPYSVITAPAQAPYTDTIQAPAQGGSPWEQPAAMKVTDPSQLGAAPPPQQVSLGGVMDLGQYNQPMQPPQPELSKEEQTNLNMYESGLGMQHQAAKGMALAAEKKAQENEKVLLDLRRTQDQIDYQRMKQQEVRDAEIAKATTGIENAQKAYQEYKVTPDRLFQGDTGRKVLAGIGIMFGAIGSALTGSKTNQALQIIENAIDRDIKAQESERDQLKEGVTQKQKYLATVRENFEDRDDAQLVQKDIALKAAQDKITEIANRYGTPEAQAKAQEAIGLLEMKRAEVRQNFYDRAQKRADAQFASEVKAMAAAQKPEKYSQAENLAAGFAERLEKAEKDFKTIESEGFERANRGTAFWESIKPESYESEHWKMQRQAEENFINAVLRRESGAAISDSEFEKAERQYFPRAGDSERVIKQKRENRELVINSFFREARGLATRDTSQEDAASQRSKYDINRTMTGGR